MIRDRGFMREMLARAKEVARRRLVFTVDMPVPGARYRDAHSGISGRNGPLRRMLQAMGKPGWAWDVGLHGRPHSLGNLASVLGKNSGLGDYMGWLGANFDPVDSLGRSRLDPRGVGRAADPQRHTRSGRCECRRRRSARTASSFPIMADDSSMACCHRRGRLPAIADAVQGKVTILADSGVRSGLDVVRLLALGARRRVARSRLGVCTWRRMAAPASVSCWRFSRRKCEWPWH